MIDKWYYRYKLEYDWNELTEAQRMLFHFFDSATLMMFKDVFIKSDHDHMVVYFRIQPQFLKIYEDNFKDEHGEFIEEEMHIEVDEVIEMFEDVLELSDFLDFSGFSQPEEFRQEITLFISYYYAESDKEEPDEITRTGFEDFKLNFQRSNNG